MGRLRGDFVYIESADNEAIRESVFYKDADRKEEVKTRKKESEKKLVFNNEIE